MREANLKGCGSREGFLTRAIEGWLRFDSLSLSLSLSLSQRQSEGLLGDRAWKGTATCTAAGSVLTRAQSLHLNNLEPACSPKNCIGAKHSSQVLVGLSVLYKKIFIMCSTKSIYVLHEKYFRNEHIGL